jgi:hypothetical protein
MMVQMTGLGPMFGQFVHFMRFAPAGNDYALIPTACTSDSWGIPGERNS